VFAEILVECSGQGICDLPSNDTVELGGSCNFNNGGCGYLFPASLWNIHTESFGGLIYGKIRGDEGKKVFLLSNCLRV
jgi:hypothetical protein